MAICRDCGKEIVSGSKFLILSNGKGYVCSSCYTPPRSTNIKDNEEQIELLENDIKRTKAHVRQACEIWDKDRSERNYGTWAEYIG